MNVIKTKPTNLLILSVILFSYLLSLLMPASAAMNMHGLNAKNENIAAICSGTGEIRWVNLTSFYQTGKLTYVDAPSLESNNDNEPSHSVNNACSVCSVVNHQDHNAIELITHFFAIDVANSEAPFSIIPRFTKLSVLSFSSRDPPSLT